MFNNYVFPKTLKDITYSQATSKTPAPFFLNQTFTTILKHSTDCFRQEH